MKKTFVPIIVLLMCMEGWGKFCNAEENPSLNFNEHLTKGREYYESGKLNDAINELNSAISLKKDCAPAFNLLTVVYLKKGSIQDRTSAERCARQAIMLDSKNVDYKVTLARVYMEQEMYEKAQKYLEDITAQYPHHKEALYLLGNLYQKNAEVLNDLVDAQDGALIDENYIRLLHEYGGPGFSPFSASKARDNAEPVLYFKDFFKREFQKAENTYKKLEMVTPHYKDMDSQLALLEYQAGDWNTMIKHAQELIQNHPENRNAYLISGLAYLRLGDYAKAQELFLEFKKKILPYERSYFEQFDLFLSKDQEDSIRAMTKDQEDSYHKKFWFSRDPLYLTSYNERELEHYGRVAEAYLLFSVPKYNLEGWKTDRGLIWIRYGPPKRRVKNLKIRTFDNLIKIPYNELKHEWWYYNNLTFQFYEFPLKSGNIRFYETREYSFREIARQIQKKQPDEFSMKIRGHKINFPYCIVDFRGDENKTRVELFYGVPLASLYYSKSTEGYSAHAKHGIFIYDKEYIEIQKNIDNLVYNSRVKKDSSDKNMIIMKKKLEIVPGMYNLAMEIKDDSADNIGTIHGKLVVESYGYKTLQVSDLLQATEIEPAGLEKYFTIADLEYKPNITGIYKKTQSIFLYFEIYNLRQKSGIRETQFQLSYSVQYKKSRVEKKWKGLSYIGKLFSFARGKFELTTSAEYTGTNPTENMYIEIDLSTLEPGLYQLSLDVKDKLSKQEARKVTVFYLE